MVKLWLHTTSIGGIHGNWYSVGDKSWLWLFYDLEKLIHPMQKPNLLFLIPALPKPQSYPSRLIECQQIFNIDLV